MPDAPSSRLSHVEYELECGSAPWRVRSLVLEERIGEPFRADLRLVSETSVPLSELLDCDATLRFTRGTGTRVLRGCITRAELLGTAAGDLHARVRFEPTIVRLRSARRFRIFEELSVREIVERLLAKVPKLRVESRLSHDPVKRDYCVQYDESDLAFISRMLEDEGIAWLLDDSGDEQVMLLVDDAAGFPKATTDEPELRIVRDRHDEADHESLQGLVFSHRPRSPATGERDWDWMVAAPGVRTERYPADAAGDTHELFHPRRWAADVIARSVQIDHEARAAGDIVGRGHSNVIGFAAGTHFELAEGGDEPVPLLLTAVRHVADCPDVEVAGARSGANYANELECMPLAVPFRPARTTPRPRVHGLQTALVTGPAAEEINVDPLGRIQVRMHWQPAVDGEAPASCWMRVGQIWAGAGYGAMVIPRVGMEVLVAFLDGDPDRPVCVGCLYNGANGTPYPLPDQKTKTTLRSRSSPGGDGFNELTFEDAASHEQIYLHAQRNLDEVVRANHTLQVGGDQTMHIGRDRNTTIDGNEHHLVEKDSTRTVVGSQYQKIEGSLQIDIQGGQSAGDLGTMYKSAAVVVTGTCSLTATERLVLKCGDSSIVMTTEDITITTPGSSVELVPNSIALKAASLGLAASGARMQLADEFALSSPAKAKLTVGASKLTLDPISARLRSVVVAATGSTSVELEAAATASIKAPAVDIAATTASMKGTASAAIEAAGASVVLEAGAVALNDG